MIQPFATNRSSILAATILAVLLISSPIGCTLQDDGGAPNPTVHGEGPGVESPADQKTVSVKVNTMTCVAGCFNGIQTVLKKRPGIQEVKLAPQTNDEGNVDNSVIFITYKGDLDKAEIERTILGAGFDSIEFLDDNAASATL